MLTPKLVEYISPHVPVQVITIISVLGLTTERIVFPKIQQVYANASLDPNTLLPFIISIIALYLSMISIYHTIKASARLIWFGIKWSIVIVGLWFILGFANQFNSNHHSNQTLSWWSKSNWNWPEFDQSNRSMLNPLKLYFLQSLPNFLDSMNLFENLFSFSKPSTSSSFHSNSNDYFNYQQSNSRKKPSSRSSSSSSDDDHHQNENVNQISEKLIQFVVQNVKEPLVLMLQEIKNKADQKGKGSKTRNR
ncbi:hypothetical protein DFH28DRAFT_227208 [Melampsora americana]|nr:hypothetical protein DFH28DRAFT_227208 [Melampsora americana]